MYRNFIPLTIPTHKLILAQITPPAIQNIGYKTYIIFAVLNAVFVPVMVRFQLCLRHCFAPLTKLQYLFYPETKGLALEDVDRLFAKNQDARRHMSIDDGKYHDVEQQMESVEGSKTLS